MKPTPLFSPRAAFAVALSLSVALLSSGCVSSRYMGTPKKTPPPMALNVPFASVSPGAVLNTVITYNGPGSWKRDAFWDEYFVMLHNPTSEPLIITDASLVDHASASLSPGSAPWDLEAESKTRERKYKDAGIAFVRQTAPGVLSIGAAVIPAVSGYYAFAGIGMAITASPAGLVILPTVLIINHNNKVAMEKEFNRRRLVLPVVLAPGETRTGSFFFPMVPKPRALNLRWSNGPAWGESTLPLDFLSGLHVKASAATTPKP